MSDSDIKKLRAAAHHHLSHDTAAAAGMSLHELQQFISGLFRPSEQQLRLLALHMKVAQ